MVVSPGMFQVPGENGSHDFLSVGVMAPPAHMRVNTFDDTAPPRQAS